MERRKYRLRQRRELLASFLRYLLLAAVVAGSYFGVRYVFRQSDAEIAEVVDRPDSPWYLIVDADENVVMRVVDDTGEMSMELTGEEVRLTTDQKKAVFIGAQATYYEDGQESIRMDAGRIDYDMDTEDFLLSDGLHIETNDGMIVDAPEVVWYRVKNRASGSGAKAPSFSFPQGVSVANYDKQNGQQQFAVEADYLQADKDLRYMEFVGSVVGELNSLKDAEFVAEREITDTGSLNLEDFEKISFQAEQMIYDKEAQVVLATSRMYDRRFRILDLDGQEVKIEDRMDEEWPVTFSKEEIRVRCAHLEAHIEKKWAACVGNVDMLIPPAEPEPDDDRALQVVKKSETRIATGELEYWWGNDHVICHQRTRVEQDDRLALANGITYWGEKKMVLLDGDITVVQGSGTWLVENELIEVGDHDMERAVKSYTELYSDQAAIYLDNNDFVASGNVRTRSEERETAADTIVYQDDIKRITAKGNVKFRDRDGQTLLCGGLVFHNEYDYMEVNGGAAATIRLPAKYANDINEVLAEMREEEVPAAITDPPVPEGGQTYNPNARSPLLAGFEIEAPEVSGAAPTPQWTGSGNGPGALPVPSGSGVNVAENGAREFVIELGEGDRLEVTETGEGGEGAGEAGEGEGTTGETGEGDATGEGNR